MFRTMKSRTSIDLDQSPVTKSRQGLSLTVLLASAAVLMTVSCLAGCVTKNQTTRPGVDGAIAGASRTFLEPVAVLLHTGSACRCARRGLVARHGAVDLRLAVGPCLFIRDLLLGEGVGDADEAE